jgi:hypothetical protein
MDMQKNRILEELERILPSVKNPGRYIGGEANQVAKDPADVLASMALVFPDAYELGMSHNGTKVLYHLLNREPDLAAERAFAPMPDMAEALRKGGIPLYALESYRPVREFSAIGISLQTELNYTNVPYVLELSGLAAFARDRAETDPLVIGGGPCMANPEPVADFFDLFVIGDGEILAVEILRRIGIGRRDGRSKADILKDRRPSRACTCRPCCPWWTARSAKASRRWTAPRDPTCGRNPSSAPGWKRSTRTTIPRRTWCRT